MFINFYIMLPILSKKLGHLQKNNHKHWFSKNPYIFASIFIQVKKKRVSTTQGDQMKSQQMTQRPGLSSKDSKLVELQDSPRV